MQRCTKARGRDARVRCGNSSCRTDFVQRFDTARSTVSVSDEKGTCKKWYSELCDSCSAQMSRNWRYSASKSLSDKNRNSDQPNEESFYPRFEFDRSDLEEITTATTSFSACQTCGFLEKQQAIQGGTPEPWFGVCSICCWFTDTCNKQQIAVYSWSRCETRKGVSALSSLQPVEQEKEGPVTLSSHNHVVLSRQYQSHVESLLIRHSDAIVSDCKQFGFWYIPFGCDDYILDGRLEEAVLKEFIRRSSGDNYAPRRVCIDNSTFWLVANAGHINMAIFEDLLELSLRIQRWRFQWDLMGTTLEFKGPMPVVYSCNTAFSRLT